MRVAALVKGVNVGGNRKLPMADLRAFIESLGYGPATTLLASGNVVFETETDSATLEPLLAEQAKAALGLDTAWFVRSHVELAAVVALNPFPDAALARPSHVLVAFHHTPFPAALLDDLAAGYAGPERLACVGRELFVDYPGNRAVDAASGDGQTQISHSGDRAQLEHSAKACRADSLT